MLKYSTITMVYIEIGANDGVLQSNTLYYEKNKRWSRLFEQLRRSLKILRKINSEKFF